MVRVPGVVVGEEGGAGVERRGVVGLMSERVSERVSAE